MLFRSENVKGEVFFAEIEAAYKPLVNEVFFRKSDQEGMKR